jgi:ubiquinone/menaquinone biosynthesis C-methylase UbiE
MSDQEQARKREIVGVFDRAAATYDSVGPQFFAHFGRRLVEQARMGPGAIVLDVAAGRGAIVYPAAQRVGPLGRVIGTDLSAEMVKKTAAEIQDGGWKNAEMLQIDAEELRFQDASFDSVLCGFSLWFFPRPQRALAEFFRVLKPGGQIALSTWSQDCPFVSWCLRIGREYLPPQPDAGPKPSHFDTAPVLEAALREAGFESIEITTDHADFAYASDEEWWNSLWSHGIRRFFEQIEESALPAVKADVLQKAQAFRKADGIHTPMRALFAVGNKPRS